MRQCISMLIGIVVLLSTTGLPRVQHLCGGIVQSAGLWIGASGCNHEIISTKSCSSHAFAEKNQQAPVASCCKKPAADIAKIKDCCTDQVEWEPSQNDLAFSDRLILDGNSPFVFPEASVVSVFVSTSVDVSPYVRPPPLLPIPQSRRRALLQVYRC